MPPSPIHAFAWHNDRLVPASGVCLSPLQTGLLTGWGLFSTLRVYRGVPFALEYHWERIAGDAARLRVSTAGLWPRVQAGLRELIDRNAAAEAVVRIYLIRNRGGLLDAPSERETDLLIFSRDLRLWGAGARLCVQPHGRYAQAPLAGTKTLTWAHNLVLLEQANARGFDDVLLLNEHGNVAECTSANVFLVRAGDLVTPPLQAGALAGVSRRVLLECAPRHGLRIVEANLRPRDLFHADEVFITSSTREVQPVTRIDDRDLSVGPVAARVEEAFRHEIEAYTAAHAPPAPSRG